MKCDSCEAKATVFYTQVTDGKLKKIVLCETCAQDQGVTDPNGLLMPEQVMNPELIEEVEVSSDVYDPDLACPTCEFTLDHLQKVGRLGCPDCYDIFSGAIADRLGSLHKAVSHVGIVPKGLAGKHALRTQLVELDEKLAEAIEKEDYEKAAKVRDELEKLKTSGEEASS